MKSWLNTKEAIENRSKSMKKWWEENRDNPDTIKRNKKISKNRKGILHTDEAKEKIRQGHLGILASEKTKEAVRKAHTGKIVSKKTKKKMSEARKGKSLLESTKEKLSVIAKERWKDEDYKNKLKETKKRLFAEGKIQSSFLGKTHTKEAKEKISKSNTGKISWNKDKTNIYSEETLKQMSLSKNGKPNLKLRGVSKSKEQNLKSSETKKRLYAEGKIKSWNKGLTKETDDRIMKCSINASKKIGELSPSWRGGKSYEPYTLDFNNKLKKAIKERDGCCTLCNIGFEDLKLLKRQIHIHHIDYNKLNSFMQNCVTLCNSCHPKTNFNRTQWIIFFQSLLKERYDYAYTENQEILFDLKFLKGGITEEKNVNKIK